MYAVSRSFKSVTITHVIITLTGENTFAIAEAERQLLDAFTAKHGAPGIERVEGEALEAARLPDLLQGTTLFAPVRLVLLRAVSANKAIHELLAGALSRASPDITVVISDPHLDKRTKFYNFLKANSNFKDFTRPNEAELIKWLQKKAETLGGQLAKEDARYLLGRAGTDQWRLLHELEKLSSHQPVITRLGIDLLVEQSAEGSAFDLLDATLAGKKELAARLLEQLRQEEDPYKFFGLLASQVHAIAVVAAAGSRSPDVVAKEAGLHPFVVRKTAGLARSLTPRQVARMAHAVATCDTQLKSTGANAWDLVAMCVQRLRVE